MVGQTDRGPNLWGTCQPSEIDLGYSQEKTNVLWEQFGSWKWKREEEAKVEYDTLFSISFIL